MNDNGLIVDSGRALKARLLAGERPLAGLGWLAVGRGNWSDKANPPLETVDKTALRDEIARKQIDRFAYLQLDDAIGTILYNGHLYKEVAGPTPIVAYYASFADGEVTAESICEEALFGGNVTTTAAPLATFAQVTAPGVMYWLRNRPEYIKGAREIYQVVAIFEEEA